MEKNLKQKRDDDYYYIKVHKDKLNAFIAIVAFYAFFKLYFWLCDLLCFDSFIFLFIFIFAAAPVTALLHRGIKAFLES